MGSSCFKNAWECVCTLVSEAGTAQGRENVRELIVDQRPRTQSARSERTIQLVQGENSNSGKTPKSHEKNNRSPQSTRAFLNSLRSHGNQGRMTHPRYRFTACIVRRRDLRSPLVVVRVREMCIYILSDSADELSVVIQTEYYTHLAFFLLSIPGHPDSVPAHVSTPVETCPSV